MIPVAISPEVRCIGYVRVSTERQAGEVQTSLADQERAILQRAKELGVEVGAWFRDEGASGASVEARPAFRQMLEACAASPRPLRDPGIILCLNDSRFGRFPDPDEAAYWRHHLRRLGWHVRFCEGDDVEDITFRAVIRSLGSAQASEYRRNIQRNARRGAKGAALQGFWTREAPFGYRRMVVYPPGAERVLEIGQLKAPNEKVRLVPHPEEAEIVRWMFEAYASGEHTLGSLTDELWRRAPVRKWSRQVVGKMLQNEVYLGHVIGGRRPADRYERMLTPIRPPSEWYECRNAHPAIVSEELFQAVQERLARNRRMRRGVRTHYLLTGVLVCTYCGRHYHGGGLGGAPDRNGRRKHIYRCSGFEAGVCPGRVGTVMRHLVDSAVVDVLARTLSRPQVQRMIAREIDRRIEALAGQRAGESLASLQQSKRRLEDRRGRLISAIARGIVTEEEAAAELERIRAEIAAVDARMHEVRFGGRRAQAIFQERDRIIEMAANFREVARRLEGPALRELVLPWIAAATFDKARRELTLKIRRVPSFAASRLPGRG